MAEYLLLMHDDTTTPEAEERWPAYLEGLAARGALRGGSAIGGGVTLRLAGTAAPTSGLTGFVRVEAPDLDGARALVAGNPTFEAGGTIEVRELPRTD